MLTRPSLRGPHGKREDERAPLPELAVDPDPAAVELHEPLREREAEAGPLADADPDVGLLELLEDALAILRCDAWSSVWTETLTSPLAPSCAHVHGPALRRELDGVREEVEDDLADAPLVALDGVDLRVGRELDPDAFHVVARSRTITTPLSSASRRENDAISSSI